jgi:hypothetical protein
MSPTLNLADGVRFRAISINDRLPYLVIGVWPRVLNRVGVRHRTCCPALRTRSGLAFVRPGQRLRTMGLVEGAQKEIWICGDLSVAVSWPGC